MGNSLKEDRAQVVARISALDQLVQQVMDDGIEEWHERHQSVGEDEWGCDLKCLRKVWNQMNAIFYTDEPTVSFREIDRVLSSLKHSRFVALYALLPACHS